MKNTRKTLYAIFFGAVFLGIVGFRQQDVYFEIAKNLDILTRLYRELHNNYVDEIEPNQLFREGVEAMLSSLDPYTNYISASEVEDYRFLSTGQYGGIGATIVEKNGTYFITEIYQGTPAQTGGINIGDEIVKIDNEDLTKTKLKYEQVRDLLRGQPKTKINITVKRYKTPQPLSLTLTREEIKVKNVPFSTVFSDKIGYLHLNSFTNDASAEVRSAIESFKNKNPDLKGIILDLRGNPGGLLNEAIQIANLFIPRNEKVVETKGRMEGSNVIYTAKDHPLDINIPLAVLINGQSASASEIVSGVMQDLDRGIIVGQRSYGKGLVQKTVPLSYNSQLKLTTAKYYTPSGRCIQALDYQHRNAAGEAVKIPDSLIHEFKTKNGRIVKDGAGILPDIQTPLVEYHPITKELVEQGIVFEFATQFYYSNPSILPAKDFSITQEVYQQFSQFAHKKGFKYKTKSEEDLTNLRESVKKESYHENVKQQLAVLEEQIQKEKENDFTDFQSEIKNILAQEITLRYYLQAGRTENTLAQDTEVQEARKTLLNQERYDKILQKSK